MAETNAMPKALTAWRDVDHSRRRFGVAIWLTGAEVSIGRRLYRVRWRRG